MLEFHWNGQRSAVCGDGIHFFLPKRLNLFSLSFSLSFSRLPGLDSLVIVTLAGRVWARLEAGVLWVVGDTSILSEEIADVMAWIHVFISSFKSPKGTELLQPAHPSDSHTSPWTRVEMQGKPAPAHPLWLCPSRDTSQRLYLSSLGPVHHPHTECTAALSSCFSPCTAAQRVQ